MDKYDTVFEKIFKRYVSGILFFILTSFALANVLYFPLIFPLNYLFFTGEICTVTAIIMVYVLPMTYIRKLARIYIIASSLSFYPVIFLSLSKGVISPLFWVIATPVLIYTVYSGKKMITWSVIYFCLMLLVFVMVFISRQNSDANQWLPAAVQIKCGIIDALFAFMLICYSLCHIRCFHALQIARLTDQKTPDDKNGGSSVPDNDDKYEKIFRQIEEYIETRRPYLNPDFKITQMANDLHINMAYITKSISKKRNMNFNSFINAYRIENVKMRMQTDTSRYTLEYIYLSSGFKSQSSFNRAFKQQTGTTPSQYHRHLNEEAKPEKDD